MISSTRLVALLVNPNNPIAERIMQDVQEAAHVKGLQLQVVKAGDESEINAAFATVVASHARGLVVGADAVFDYRRQQLVALAARHAVPTVYFAREFVAAGGLISYGTSLTAAYHQAGKVLNGAKPADLPVQQPTRFDLVVNLKTAKTLGLTVPPAILARADEVIE